MYDITEWLKYPFWLSCDSSNLGGKTFASLNGCGENHSKYFSCIINLDYNLMFF